MQLVERHILMNRPDLEHACTKSKLLYNQVLYYLRHMYFGKIEWCHEFQMSTLMAAHNDESFRMLPNNVSQQTIKFAYKAMKSFHKASAQYKKYPEKFNGQPKLPKYKKELAPVYFTYVTCRLKNDGHIHFNNNIINPIKTTITNAKSIKQVRIIPQATCFVVEVVYEKETTDALLNKQNFLSIDLGINNLATCMSNVGQPFITNGKCIKSFNRWFNKTMSVFQGFIGDRGKSKRINQLLHYRNCWIEDKMHKVSRFIINYCKDHDIGTIIIGKNDGWKESINIGRVNNQKFLNIPHAKLIEKIKYKAELLHIQVFVVEESYTSKIDHLAYEPMRHHEKYLGRRVRRGLFQSTTGKIINADVNGCIGIARKVFGDSVINLIINSGLAYRDCLLTFMSNCNYRNQIANS